MLPHKHFAISGATIAAVTYTFYPEKSMVDILKWVLFGGLLSAAMDLDVFAIVYFRSQADERIKPFRNLLNIFRDFRGFKDAIAKSGVLKTGMISHFIISSFLGLLFYFLSHNYFIPAILGIISHLASDLPNFKRLVPKN